jgi:hypothetical protein
MAHVFTNVGEFRRGKGNRKTRLGPRTRADINARRGGIKQTQTPDDIAIKKLGKKLAEMSQRGISASDRYAYIGLMAHAEQIRFMNMSVLAEVFVYMKNAGGEITNANFNYNAIRGYIDNLLPRREILEGGVRTKEIPEEELEIMRLRMAATFLRYIHYITQIREQADEELRLGNLQETEIIPPSIDI